MSGNSKVFVGYSNSSSNYSLVYIFIKIWRHFLLFRKVKLLCGSIAPQAAIHNFVSRVKWNLVENFLIFQTLTVFKDMFNYIEWKWFSWFVNISFFNFKADVLTDSVLAKWDFRRTLIANLWLRACDTWEKYSKFMWTIWSSFYMFVSKILDL